MRVVVVLCVAIFLTPAVAHAEPPTISDGGWDVPVGHSLLIMTGMRTVEAALYPIPFADSPIEWGTRYESALTKPPLWDASQHAFEWDGDPWPLNVFGHAVFGSELYFRPRVCGKNISSALLFATAMSTTWEYVFEANGVRPSALDLMYTPVAGLVLGEARYQAWRAAGAIRHRVGRTILRVLLDPFGELERAILTPC